MKIIQRLAVLLLALCMLAGLCACSDATKEAFELSTGALEDLENNQQGFNAAFEEFAEEIEAEDAAELDPDGVYTSKEDVALYLHIYGKLPQNFMTKSEARELGWSGGGLDGYADGMCIGGDVFGNYEGLLPEGSYHECDLETLHAGSRGAKRLVYSDDGRIYYTEDHYESFELLYGEE